MQKKHVILIGAIIFGLGYFIGSYNQKEVVKIVEKEKIVKVETSQKEEKKDIKKQVVITEKPNGEKVTVITEEDKTQTNENKKQVLIAEKERQETITNKRNFALGIGYGRAFGTNLGNAYPNDVYSIEGRLRLFNTPLWLGGEIIKDQDLKGLIKLEVEF